MYSSKTALCSWLVVLSSAYGQGSAQNLYNGIWIFCACASLPWCDEFEAITVSVCLPKYLTWWALWDLVSFCSWPPLCLPSSYPRVRFWDLYCFLIYINDLTRCSLSRSAKLLMLTMPYYISHRNFIAFHNDVDNIRDWSLDNHLSLNINKTKLMLISHSKHYSQSPQIVLDGTKLEQVFHCRYLGVWLSSGPNTLCLLLARHTDYSDTFLKHFPLTVRHQLLRPSTKPRFCLFLFMDVWLSGIPILRKNVLY